MSLSLNFLTTSSGPTDKFTSLNLAGPNKSMMYFTLEEYDFKDL